MKVEPTTEPLDNTDLKHLYLFFYLIPILGFFPSLWTLYRSGRGAEEQSGKGAGGQRGKRVEEQKGRGEITIQNSSSHQPLDTIHSPSPQPLASSPSLSISRLSVTLAFAWLLAYLLLNIGAATSEFLTLRLLVLNSLLTSGYFLVSIWLMVRLASGSSVRLPGFTSLAERVFGKHLS